MAKLRAKFLNGFNFNQMRIVVASKNPVKINSTRLGFESYFSDFEIESADVDSGVSDQPMSDEETLKGAWARSENAKKMFPDANYWVGIEGGIQVLEEKWIAFAWIVVMNGEKTGESRTTSFQLPLAVASLIEKGYELGTANDILFQKENSKQKAGAVGILSHDVVNRTELYKQAVQLALIPLINPRLY